MFSSMKRIQKIDKNNCRSKEKSRFQLLGFTKQLKSIKSLFKKHLLNKKAKYEIRKFKKRLNNRSLGMT